MWALEQGVGEEVPTPLTGNDDGRFCGGGDALRVVIAGMQGIVILAAYPNDGVVVFYLPLQPRGLVQTLCEPLAGVLDVAVGGGPSVGFV